jgi:prolyl 4-hydroxylase
LARHKGQVRPHSSAWSRLRKSINLKAWRSPPHARTLSDDPLIQAVDRFVGKDVCDWIIERARERLAPAMVFDPVALRPIQVEARSNSVAGFDLVYLDLVVLLVRERLAAFGGRPTATMEAPQVFHYAVGQQFALHDDFLEEDVAGHAAQLARRGQRVQTLLIYLNDGYEGGETDFPLLGLKVKGRKGDALMFTNVMADGSPERRMRHAGLAPIAGEKWLFSQWVRDRPPPGRGGQGS